MNQEFLNKIIPLAVEDEKVSKVPAEVTVGQAIQESGWGNSQLTALGNNLFGIKATGSWGGETILMNGYEFENGRNRHSQMKWRKYSSWKDSISDHGIFLSKPRYKVAFKTTNWQDFLREVHKAGYATDPDYVSDIINIIKKYGIERLIQRYRDV